MEFAKNITRVSALALGIAGVLAYGDVHAAAFQLKENSVKAQGRAMAGAASAKGDASVVVNNPAVMSTFTERTLQADVTAIDLSYEFEGSGTAATGTPFQQPLTGGNGGDAGDVAAVPAASFILPLSGDFEYLTLGMMISAPFGLKTEYDDGWKGRYHALESDVKIVDLTLAASLELSDRFSVGAGFIYEHADVTLSNAVDFGTIICSQNPAACVTPSPAAAPFGPQRNDGFASINGTSNSFGWIVGLNWRPTDKLSLGYSHRSEIDHELEGDSVFVVPGNVRAAFDANPLTRPLFRNGGGGADLTTPAIDAFSATYYATDRFTVMAEVTRTDWSSLQEIRIEFDNPAQPDSAEEYNWDENFFYSLGGEYKFSDAFTFRAGVARDDSPVSRPYRTPRLPDQDRMWYSLGLTWTVSEHFELSASYVKIDIVDTPEVDLTTSTRARLVGDFEGGADLFGVSMQYTF
ncbi:outer membrane protein transport protein [Pseudoxanthomonas sp. SL93]|jgi:long-chain fatty acid transport protein|uniref:OmpP1/FadL family transporter n=1 Tax=Pseudoxanthomonas sp. SL93 TaxID=2995142 RepID=UPI0022707862|nr:outer membrane protein transport protein [Pseudoxanthomonas sp. SL93]WAC62604.1 outer membrane protein transport protein [Pseudoxanthomonas sp. SL93]